LVEKTIEIDYGLTNPSFQMTLDSAFLNYHLPILDNIMVVRVGTNGSYEEKL